MNSSIVKEFLLFELEQWLGFGDSIVSFCQAAIFPIFVFALIIDNISINQSPIQILKRTIIAQVILILLPTYYEGIAGFGFNAADSVMKDQRRGLIANWITIKKNAERIAKTEKKPIDSLTAISNIFSFNSSDVAEKIAGLAIFICTLIIKVIFSVVYYGTYSVIGIWAVLAIFPQFDKNLLSIFKSVLYLILTPILISLVLVFMNEALTFFISADGFIDAITEMAKFLVLCFLLLGTLLISHNIVNGAGLESWAAKMGGQSATTIPKAAIVGAVAGGFINPSKSLANKTLGYGKSRAMNAKEKFASSDVAKSFRSLRSQKSSLGQSSSDLSKDGTRVTEQNLKKVQSSQSSESKQGTFKGVNSGEITPQRMFNKPQETGAKDRSISKNNFDNKSLKESNTRSRPINKESLNMTGSKAQSMTRNLGFTKSNIEPRAIRENKRVSLVERDGVGAVNKKFAGRQYVQNKKTTEKNELFKANRGNKK
jgi:hypothetical protein